MINTTETTRPAPSRWLLFAAFFAIYVVWGSSYIANKIAITSVPPFLMSGTRYAFAGMLLMGWALARGAGFPTRTHWKSSLILGLILFTGNNAAIIWSQGQGLPSGVTSLLVATVPLWVVLIEWIHKRKRPAWSMLGGVVIGFVGIALLIDPSQSADIALVPALVVVVGAFLWSLGTIITPRMKMPDSPILSTGLQLFTGGLMLVVLAGVTGDFARFDASQVQIQSVLAMLYQAIFSSCISFTAFVWLMRVSDASTVSTYAYVNPVVAVFLGWVIAGETLTADMLFAAGIIVFAVFVITQAKSKKSRANMVARLLRRRQPEVAKEAAAPIAAR